MADDNDDKSIDKKILSLIKDFYHPDAKEEQEEQEFEVFFGKLEDKLENDTTQKKISNLAADLEDQFISRQQRLYQAKNRLESGFFEKKENKFKQRKLVRNSFLVAGIVVCLGLASIATFKYNDAYKVIDFETKETAWNELELSREQRKKIDELDKQWQNYKNFEVEKIQIAKTRLQKEVNKDNPDFQLIDKYQREIFDLESHLKQQKFNSDLEKRFVLNQKQSLKLIREGV